MNAQDKYETLQWAEEGMTEYLDKSATEVDKLYMMHLRDMLAEAKREAGR